MLLKQVQKKLRERTAQILLPSVLLAPIFILVIYLLFETAKVSMTKVRQQFALDNSAYTQVTSAAVYLNAVAMINGPLPHRVLMQDFTGPNMEVEEKHGGGKLTVFDLFYKGDGIPSIGPDYNTGLNKPPSAESTNWGLQYYQGEEVDEGADRAGLKWLTENPPAPDNSKSLPVMSKMLVDDYYFEASNKGKAVGAIVSYLETFARTGSIYKSQDYIYQQLSKNAIVYRETYFLNVNDCKRSDCARESAAQIRQMLKLKTKPFEINKVKFYASESGRFGHSGSYEIPFVATEILNGEKLFQFAYLDSASRGRLKTWSRGIALKQPFKLPRNHFNINLEQKYKPYVHNKVILSCPRSGNNCVWPNPLPKYAVTLRP